MAIIKPFTAVRPKPGMEQEVAALPYDVMNTAEARVMAKGKPNSFLHVSRAEIDLPEGIDEHAQQVYDKARENFERMIGEGVLFREHEPCLYIYAQVMNGRRQTGLVACSSVEDYFKDVIKKHELTRPEKEKDRIDHMETLQAHVGPIFLTYRAHAEADNLIKQHTIENAPVYDITSSDGIQHTIWVIDNTQTIQRLVNIFENEIPFTYIADGHHRTASAAKVGLKMKERNAHHTGQEEYNFFLSVLFPHNQIAILDYNRLVKDLNGLSDEEFLQKVKEKYHVSAIALKEDKPFSNHEFGMYLSGQWYSLTPKFDIPTDPVGVLDVSVLSSNLLEPVLGIKDQRTDKRIDFVGGIRGLKELQRRVDNGEMKVAFAIPPVTLNQLMDIADNGMLMPPKCTWFEPKLRDGFFSHLF